MPKSIQNTTLSFGLVTVPVRVMTAGNGSDGRSEFRLASPAGNPVKQTYIDEETGEVVGSIGECERGIFDENGFHPVPIEAVKAIDEATKIDGLNVVGFAPFDEIPWERVRKSYYLHPGAKGGPAVAQPMVALARALRKTGRAGIGVFTVTAKHYPFVIYTSGDDDRLILAALAFADEVQGFAQAGIDSDVSDTITEVATTLVEKLAVPASMLNEFVDDRGEQRAALIADVVAGKEIAAPAAAAAPEPVADLAAMLAASVEDANKKPKKKAA